jgi:hypothetical protein
MTAIDRSQTVESRLKPEVVLGGGLDALQHGEKTMRDLKKTELKSVYGAGAKRGSKSKSKNSYSKSNSNSHSKSKSKSHSKCG